MWFTYLIYQKRRMCTKIKGSADRRHDTTPDLAMCLVVIVLIGRFLHDYICVKISLGRIQIPPCNCHKKRQGAWLLPKCFERVVVVTVEGHWGAVMVVLRQERCSAGRPLEEDCLLTWSEKCSLSLHQVLLKSSPAAQCQHSPPLPLLLDCRPLFPQEHGLQLGLSRGLGLDAGQARNGWIVGY